MAGEVELFVISLLTATLRLGTPLLLSSLGEIIDQRSGILNMGLEGIMATGAFAAFAVTYFTQNVWLGILAAIVTGAIFGLLHGVVSIKLRVNQVICGLGIAILGVGLAGFLYRGFFGFKLVPPQITTTYIKIFDPKLAEIPIIGPLIFGQNIFFFLAVILVIVLGIVLFRTSIGLKIRAVGEKPKAADTVGVNVFRIRYACVIFGSILAALGGACLTLDVGTFREYMIAGRGWITFALVVFVRWNPYFALGGSLLFAGVDALQLRLQTIFPGTSPYIFWMLPYILTLIILVAAAFRKGTDRPASLGKPYLREE